MSYRILLLFMQLALAAPALAQQPPVAEPVSSTEIHQLSEVVATYLRVPPLPVRKLPAGYTVSLQQLVELTCPELPASCKKKVAIYDPRYHRLLLLDTLSEYGELIRRSFLLHELVHVYQHNRVQPKIRDACQRSLQNEREAYHLQSRFLSDHGDNRTMGEQLRGALCRPERKP